MFFHTQFDTGNSSKTLDVHHDTRAGVPKVWSRGPLNHTKTGTIVATKCDIR